MKGTLHWHRKHLNSLPFMLKHISYIDQSLWIVNNLFYRQITYLWAKKRTSYNYTAWKLYQIQKARLELSISLLLITTQSPSDHDLSCFFSVQKCMIATFTWWNRFLQILDSWNKITTWFSRMNRFFENSNPCSIQGNDCIHSYFRSLHSCPRAIDPCIPYCSSSFEPSALLME